MIVNKYKLLYALPVLNTDCQIFFMFKSENVQQEQNSANELFLNIIFCI